MRKNPDLYFRILLVALDTLALIGAFTAAYILRISLDHRPFHIEIGAIEFITSVFMILPLWIILFYFFGLYDREVYSHPLREFGRLMLAAVCGIMVMISFTFFTNIPLFPAKLVAVYAMGISFAILLILRSFANIIRLRLLRSGVGVKNLVIVGDSTVTQDIADHINSHPSTGFRISAIVAKNKFITSNLRTLRKSSLKSALASNQISAIIQTDNKDVEENYELAQKNYLEFYYSPNSDGLMTSKHSVQIINSMPIIYLHSTPLIGYGRIIKRVVDIFGSAIGIILSSPIMILVAIAVKIGDPKGPIFMRGKQQSRLTRYNRPFKVYKFRSHYAKFDGKTDEEVFEMVGRPELIKEYRANGDKLDYDFRVTPVGKFIRRFSLDELPQLFNVLKGDISLVGPRALVPNELKEYDKKHTLLAVKSGLTGLAVVSGRRNISFEERRKLDLYYVRNWSLWLDVVIILRTFIVIFQKES